MPFYKVRAMELSDATNELGCRCSGLHDKRELSSPFV